MVRMKDVAALAKVSSATVSYVINNTGHVSGETEQRVRRAIEELGYRPNRIAKSLKTKKTNTIGVIVEDITVFNAPGIIDAINENAEDLGYSIVLSNLRIYQRIGNDFEDAYSYQKLVERAVGELLEKHVDGIIYVGIHSRDVNGVIGDVQCPVVYAYCYSRLQGSHFVTYDDESSAYEVMKYVLTLGHRYIGIITGPAGSRTVDNRLKGCSRAMERFGVHLNQALIREGDWDYDSGYSRMRELLSQKGLTAVFAMNDLLAGGAIAACHEMGIAIPQDVSIIGFDDRDCARLFSPQLTTMAMPLHDIGLKAMDMVVQLIDGHPVAQPQLALKGTLIKRQSILAL